MTTTGLRRRALMVGLAVAAVNVLLAPVARAAGCTSDLDWFTPHGTIAGIPYYDLPGQVGGGAIDIQLPDNSRILVTADDLGVTDAGAHFGAAVLHADLNGDSCSDVVVGAPDFGTGAAFVIPGSSTGPVLGSAFQITTGATPGSPNRTGASLAFTEVAGGPRALWIGAPDIDVSGATHAGAILRYSTADNGSGGVTTTFSAKITQATSGVPGVPEAGDHFGEVLSFSRTWLGVGIPHENVGSETDAGAVALATLASNGTLSWQDISQDAPGVPGAAEAGDRFGASLVGGLTVVGVPGEDVGSISNAGMVQRFTRTNSTTVAASTALTQDTSGIPGESESGDQFGTALTTIVHLEATYIVIGAPTENVGSVSNAGAVWMYNTDFGTCTSHRAGAGLPGSPQAGAELGRALTTASDRPDFEEDIDDHVVVGAPKQNVSSVTDAGYAWEMTISGTGSVSSVARPPAYTTPQADAQYGRFWSPGSRSSL